MMRKLIILVTLAVAVSIFSTAQAEVREGSFSLGLSAGGYFFENNQDYQDNVALGLRAGYQFTESLGSEVFCYYVPSEFEDRGNSRNKFYFAGIEGLYHFMPGSSLVPYVALGLGATHYSSGDARFVPSKFAFDYGAGIKYFLTESLSLRMDVRHVLPVGDKEEYGDNPHKLHHDLLATLGIGYDFGGKKAERAGIVESEPLTPASAPAPVQLKPSSGDMDKDGVPDSMDKCPDTPYGITVDQDGCPVDSDFDGIPDYLDQCPQIPRGVDGGEDGCPAKPAPRLPVVEEQKSITKTVSITLALEFDTAKAVIKKQYHNEIRKIADFMKAHPEAKAVIGGHIDNVDIHRQPQRNMRLSQARADSVRQYLIDQFGISADRISAVGYGPGRPIASNDTVEGRKKNRRVEAVIEGIQTQ